MTLALSVQGRHTIWVVADRRLSAANGSYRDDGIKVLSLETTDAVAILAYAGLGATAKGTQPSAWMSSVLRGRKMPLEASLGTVAEAMKREFPKHLHVAARRVPVAHNVLVAAFVGPEPRLYTIDLVYSQAPNGSRFRYTRHVVDADSGDMRSPRIGLAGSGARALIRDKSWMRDTLRLVANYESHKVTNRTVADHLARLNAQVSSQLLDGTVSPKSVVVWKARTGWDGEGGGHAFYDGSDRESHSPALPAVAGGFDVQAIVSATLPATMKYFDALFDGQGADKDTFDKELSEAVARLPDGPDERLL